MVEWGSEPPIFESERAHRTGVAGVTRRRIRLHAPISPSSSGRRLARPARAPSMLPSPGRLEEHIVVLTDGGVRRRGARSPRSSRGESAARDSSSRSRPAAKGAAKPQSFHRERSRRWQSPAASTTRTTGRCLLLLAISGGSFERPAQRAAPLRDDGHHELHQLVGVASRGESARRCGRGGGRAACVHYGGVTAAARNSSSKGGLDGESTPSGR